MYEQIITIVLVAIVLGADAFSLSLGMGIKGVSRSYEIRFAAAVGLSHVLMPLIGLGLGLAAGKLLGIWAARLGAAVLVYIGADLIFKGYRAIRPQAVKFSEARQAMQHAVIRTEEGWISLMLLTLSVSIDALTTGFSLGTVKMPLAITVLITGTIAGSMTLLGFRGGRIFNRLVGSYAQIIGGIILVALAVKMVF
ncbi:MAG: manganese efflux pump MntP family protein [Syntrophomonadaceae bacterium]|jgi:putative Mn2+ efflux pump MntP